MIFDITTANRTRNTQKLWIALGCMVGLLMGLAGCSSSTKTEGGPVSFSTPYQLVLLSNNSVYFGRLSGWGTSSPVLTDVFYVVTNTNPDTKLVSTALVKRSKEPHHPDKMYLNPSQVVFVEPVGPDSKVFQLINDASKQ